MSSRVLDGLNQGFPNCDTVPGSAAKPQQGHHAKRTERRAMKAIEELFLSLCLPGIGSTVPILTSPFPISGIPDGSACWVALWVFCMRNWNEVGPCGYLGMGE